MNPTAATSSCLAAVVTVAVVALIVLAALVLAWFDHAARSSNVDVEPIVGTCSSCIVMVPEALLRRAQCFNCHSVVLGG